MTINVKELQKELYKIDPKLTCEAIKKDKVTPELNGNLLSFNQENVGDVKVKYEDNLVLTLTSDTDLGYYLDFAFEAIDKESAGMFGSVVKLCGSYLPDNEEDK